MFTIYCNYALFLVLLILDTLVGLGPVQCQEAHNDEEVLEGINKKE
jgi:hypothetical protein